MHDIESLQLRWIGHRIRAETGIVVDHHLGVIDAHAIAVDAHHRLLHQVPRLSEATVHVIPTTSDGKDHHATPGPPPLMRPGVVGHATRT